MVLLFFLQEAIGEGEGKGATVPTLSAASLDALSAQTKLTEYEWSPSPPIVTSIRAFVGLHPISHK